MQGAPTVAADGVRTRDRRTRALRRLGRFGAPVALVVGLAIVLVPTATKAVVSVDEHAAAVQAWRIASAGTPWLEGVASGHERLTDEWIHEAPNGHVVADRMAGPILVSVPFYWVLGNDPRPQGFSVVPAGVASAALTTFTGLLMFLALRRRLGDLMSSLAAAAFVLATPTWAVSADGPWTHAVTQFGLAGAAYGSSRGRWGVAGLFLGVGMWGRPHLAVVALVLGLGMSWSARSRKPAVGVGAASLVVLLALTLWNRWMFGVWAVTSAGYVGHAASIGGGSADGASLWDNTVGFLFAPDRGFLVWTPVVLVLVPAVLRSRRQLPSWVGWLALGGLAYTALQLRFNGFAGGDGFYGYRHGLELVTCLTPALAMSLPAVQTLGRALVAVVAALQAGAIALGATADALFVPAQLVWSDNAFLAGLRQEPGPVTVWTSTFVLLGIGGAILWIREQRPARGTVPVDRQELPVA